VEDRVLGTAVIEIDSAAGTGDGSQNSPASAAAEPPLECLIAAVLRMFEQFPE
jgi:hypothetical protein